MFVHLATGSATTDHSGDSASKSLIKVDFPVAVESINNLLLARKKKEEMFNY